MIFRMRLYKLNKTVLSIRNNPARFLSGLTANTLDKPQNVFLNIHGRIVAVFDQIKVGADEFRIIVEDPFVDVLLQHVDRYAKLSKVRVERLEKNVYFDLEDNRNFVSGAEGVIPQKKGRVIISGDELETSVSQPEFTLFRVRNNMPAQGADYTDEFVLNVGARDLVSFTKGCFLGQEPVAKVHNRSRPTWQLVVKYVDECAEEEKRRMTSKVFDPDSNRTAGFLFVRSEPARGREDS